MNSRMLPAGNAGGTTSTSAEPIAAPLLTYGGPTQTGAGSFSLRASGALRVAGAVEVRGGGNLLLQSDGAFTVAETATVTVLGGAGSASGSLSILAGGAITLASASALLTEGGDIDVESRSAGIAMASQQSSGEDEPVAAATIRSQGGNIRLAAAGDLRVSEVDASAPGDRKSTRLNSSHT